MDIESLKYVVGSAEPGKPAVIRFFTSVCEESANALVNELLWLQEEVKPSKIVLMINSEGGSVLHGMSAFSAIMGCPIEIDCVVEGLAASMGSVLWTAGDNLYMHDYSLLMIHNPFCRKGDCEDPSIQQMIGAFRSQLETIYRKRFGMSKDQVAAIMEGEGGADGTFFTAEEAVKAGLIPADHVIKTTKQVRDKVKGQLEGLSDVASMRDALTAVAAELDDAKLMESIGAIHNQKDITNIQDHTVMNENETLNFDAISAQLGFSKDAQMAAVQARVAELLGAEETLKSVQGELSDLKIQFTGKEAELSNVQSELEETKASLKKYQDAEASAREAEIAETVQAAITAGKIEDSAKDMWIEMAHANLDLVKSTLASIRGRDNIEEKIANDPANVEHIEDTLTDVEKQMQAEIEARFGKTEFKKF